MTAFKDRTGENRVNNEGCKFKIIEYFGWDNCTIEFPDGNILKNISYGNIQKGNVKNPFHRSVYGVGYMGVGKYTSKKDIKKYTMWVNLIKRCYSLKCQEKHPSYKECLVDRHWHNFQVFAKWVENNFKQGWQLDKDILKKGNKIYSPETCVFVPQEVNLVFVNKHNHRGIYPIGVHITEERRFQAAINKNSKRIVLGTFATPEEAFQVYKIAKEEYIKEMADKWRGQITEPTYYAMYAYKVEITD